MNTKDSHINPNVIIADVLIYISLLFVLIVRLEIKSGHS